MQTSTATSAAISSHAAFASDTTGLCLNCNKPVGQHEYELVRGEVVPVPSHDTSKPPARVTIYLSGKEYVVHVQNGNMVSRVDRGDEEGAVGGFSALYEAGIVGRVWGGPASFAAFDYYINLQSQWLAGRTSAVAP